MTRNLNEFLADEMKSNAALYAAFIMDGLTSRLGSTEMNIGDVNFTKTVAAATSYARLVNALVDEVIPYLGSQDSTDAVPSSICHPFGCWIAGNWADHRHIPDHGRIVDWLSERTLSCLSARQGARAVSDVVRAVKRVCPGARIDERWLRLDRNWEWIESANALALQRHFGSEHPQWRRFDWNETAVARSLPYWAWVAARVEVTQLEALYAELAVKRDIFSDAICGDLISVAGHELAAFNRRTDLLALEVLEALPRRTIITKALLDRLPPIAASFKAIGGDLGGGCWCGRPLEDFLEPHASACNPKETVVVSIPSSLLETGNVPMHLTLEDLWDAEPAETGWRLESGVTLRFLKRGDLEAGVACSQEETRIA